METQLWRASNASRRCIEIRFGDLWRRRLHARTHARHRRAHRARNRYASGRASYLRLGEARGSRQCDPLYRDIGVRHIVALRGDPPGGVGTPFMPHPLGYPSSSHLVRGIRAIGDFEISVSTYPEGHPESSSIDSDIDALKSKIDAGATRAITQFFFDNDIYLRFLERARARGITIPIVPGIMPIRNFKLVAGFAAKAGASVPRWLADRFDGLENDPETHALVAATTTAEQVMDLVKSGVNEFHFYTNNRADLVFGICHLLACARPARKRQHDFQ